MDVIKICFLGSQGSGKSTLISSFVSKAHYNPRFQQIAGSNETNQTPPYSRTKKNEYFLMI